MIITTTETYWQLTIQWGWSDLGYTHTHTSLHKMKSSAEQRAWRVMRETTGLGAERVTPLMIAEREGNSYAELQAGETEFNYSITAVEVED